MTIPSNVSRFLFEMPSLKEELRVVGFQCQEALDAPFCCTLELASPSRDLDMEGLLGKAGVLTLFDEQNPRFFHGEVVEFAQGAIGKRFTTYYVTLRPKLWLLQMRSGMRIFQDQSAPDIIQQVLQDAGIQNDDVRLSLNKNYSARTYCVQYRETDFDFVSRLMQQEGIFYYFEHRLDGHALVITDQHNGLPKIVGESVVPYRARTGMVAGSESVYELDAQHQLVSGASASRDYFFEKPGLLLESKQNANQWQALEQYQYPGRYQASSVGSHYAKAHLSGYSSFQQWLSGKSDCPRLQVGKRFSLKEHPHSSSNQDYLVVATLIEGRQPQSLEEGASSEGSSFSVSFKVIPARCDYYPPHTTPHPKIEGVQTAFVTGPKGEEIYTDKFGRVKVQFHWDRQGKRDETSSCWLRVGQSWAGNQWGSMAIPRIGQEVIVTFLNGDPDRPLISGALYNAKTMPPYGLPSYKTRTTLKTQTSPGGSGYNELRIEDKKGSEQIFIHGQKDVEVFVKNDFKRKVDSDFHQIVNDQAFEEVGADLHNKVGKNKNHKVGKSLSQNIGQDYQHKAGTTYKHQTGQNHSIKAGTNAMLDAGLSLTLKAGSGTIVFDPSGVAITGSQVRINSGGGAGSAKGASPTAPTKPQASDPGSPGSNIVPVGAQAKFKQSPVQFDQAKLKEADSKAAEKLSETFVHGNAFSNSLSRKSAGSSDPAGDTYRPEQVASLLSGNFGGQMSRNNGKRETAAELKAAGAIEQDTVVNLEGLTREQKIDTVFNETGYFLSEQTAQGLIEQVDSGADTLVITDAVTEGTQNAVAYINDQEVVKAYRKTLESYVSDPEMLGYGGGANTLAGLSEGERVASNVLKVNSDKMPAALKDAAIQDFVTDGALLAAGAVPGVGFLQAGKRVSNNSSVAARNSIFGSDGTMTRLGDAPVIKQPPGPFCGPTSCAMVLESAGKKVDVNDLISQLGKKVVGDGTNKTDGVFMKDLVPLLNDRGIPASHQRLSTSQLEKALESGNPAIVNVKRPLYDPETGLQKIDKRGKPVWGGHAVVVDNIKLVHGKKSVAIRDPHGKQYYQLYENFQKDFLFEAITTKGVY